MVSLTCAREATIRFLSHMIIDKTMQDFSCKHWNCIEINDSIKVGSACLIFLLYAMCLHLNMLHLYVVNLLLFWHVPRARVTYLGRVCTVLVGPPHFLP